DARSHASDLLFPIRRVSGQPRLRRSLSLRRGAAAARRSYPLRFTESKISRHVFGLKIRQHSRQFLELKPKLQAVRDGAGAGEGLDLPKLRPAAIIIFVSRKRIDEQPFLSVRAQTGIGDKGDSQFGWTGEQFHDLHRQTLQLGQILRVARRYENNVQVRTIANLAATRSEERRVGKEWRSRLSQED